MSIWHWLIVLILCAAIVIPFWKLLPRAGIPGWVAIFSVVPFVALIFLWVLAFKKWPQDNKSTSAAA